MTIVQLLNYSRVVLPFPEEGEAELPSVGEKSSEDHLPCTMCLLTEEPLGHGVHSAAAVRKDAGTLARWLQDQKIPKVWLHNYSSRQHPRGKACPSGSYCAGLSVHINSG